MNNQCSKEKENENKNTHQFIGKGFHAVAVDIDDPETGEIIIEAGELIDEKIYAIGGRVLNFVCLSENFSLSRTQIIDSIKSLNWNGGFYRKDIAYKVINE